jgi:hypothetical protein
MHLTNRDERWLTVDRQAGDDVGIDEGIILCKMVGVREYGDRAPVELVRWHGRLVIRAWNECGNNYTSVDLLDLMKWLSIGPKSNSEGNESRINGNGPSGN